ERGLERAHRVGEGLRFVEACPGAREKIGAARSLAALEEVPSDLRLAALLRPLRLEGAPAGEVKALLARGIDAREERLAHAVVTEAVDRGRAHQDLLIEELVERREGVFFAELAGQAHAQIEGELAAVDAQDLGQRARVGLERPNARAHGFGEPSGNVP